MFELYFYNATEYERHDFDTLNEVKTYLSKRKDAEKYTEDIAVYCKNDRRLLDYGRL